MSEREKTHLAVAPTARACCYLLVVAAPPPVSIVDVDADAFGNDDDDDDDDDDAKYWPTRNCVGRPRLHRKLWSKRSAATQRKSNDTRVASSSFATV